MKFLVSDYYATGEGRTVCILVTRALPNHNDYTIESQFDDAGVWQLSELGNSEDFRAAREFVEEFGASYTWGATSLEKETFLEEYGHYISDVVKKLIDSDAGNVFYTAKLHFNFA